MIRKYALQRKGESLIFILMGFWITIYFNVMTFWWTVWSGIWYFIHMVIHVHIVGYIFPLFLSSGRLSPSPNIQNTWSRSSNVKPLVGPPVPGRQKPSCLLKDGHSSSFRLHHPCSCHLFFFHLWCKGPWKRNRP